jgi:hypothetical protein
MIIKKYTGTYLVIKNYQIMIFLSLLQTLQLIKIKKTIKNQMTLLRKMKKIIQHILNIYKNLKLKYIIILLILIIHHQQILMLNLKKVIMQRLI